MDDLAKRVAYLEELSAQALSSQAETAVKLIELELAIRGISEVADQLLKGTFRLTWALAAGLDRLRANEGPEAPELTAFVEAVLEMVDVADPETCEVDWRGQVVQAMEQCARFEGDIARVRAATTAKFIMRHSAAPKGETRADGA